jgi:hypothetical protein
MARKGSAEKLMEKQSDNKEYTVVIAARQGLLSSYNAASFIIAALSIFRNKTVKES